MSSTNATHSPPFATLPTELQHLVQQTAYLCDDSEMYQLLCSCEGDNGLELDNPTELGSEEQSAILNANTEPQEQASVDVGYVMTILSLNEQDMEDIVDEQDMDDLDGEQDMEDIDDEQDTDDEQNMDDIDDDDDEGYAITCHCEPCKKFYRDYAIAEAKAKAEAEEEAAGYPPPVVWPHWATSGFQTTYRKSWM